MMVESEKIPPSPCIGLISIPHPWELNESVGPICVQNGEWVNASRISGVHNFFLKKLPSQSLTARP